MVWILLDGGFKSERGERKVTAILHYLHTHTKWIFGGAENVFSFEHVVPELRVTE